MKKISFVVLLLASLAAKGQQRFRFHLEPKIECDTVTKLDIEAIIGSDSTIVKYTTITIKGNVRATGNVVVPNAVVPILLQKPINIADFNAVLGRWGLVATEQITD